MTCTHKTARRGGHIRPISARLSIGDGVWTVIDATLTRLLMLIEIQKTDKTPH